MKRIFGEKRRGLWLVALGMILTVFSLVMLGRIPPIAQYMAPAPEETAKQTAEDGAAQEEPLAPSMLRGMVDSWENNRGELGEVENGMSAVRYGEYFDSSAGQTAQGALTAVEAGWFGVYPRYLKEGRLFSEDEGSFGHNVVVLDEQLAFELFPTTEPTQGRVNISGEWYDVIGVVRHRRGAGDVSEFGAYIPLMAAARHGIQMEYVQLSCAAPSMGSVRAMENLGMNVLGNGTFCYTEKEIMRVTMILRIVLIIMGLYLLGFLLGRWNARTVSLIRGWQQEVLKRYFKTMLPSVAGYSLLQLAGYAALACAAFGLLRLIIAPMYMFTEWIPEVIVEWNKISARFFQLLTASAAPVRYQTSEYAAIRFYGALTRWGVLCVLMGIMLMKKWGVKPGIMKKSDDGE